MRYCLVLSVGYSVAVLLLWELLALLWSFYYPAVVTYAVYGPAIALGAFLAGSLVNCLFQEIGTVLSLKPSLSIMIGWSLLSLLVFVASLGAPPTNVESYARTIVAAAQAATNTFPASKIFYDIGNFTLSLVGIK